MRLIALPLLLLAALSALSAEPAQPYPLWDGQETIAEYAKRTGLEPTKTLDLGNGVRLELALIPAGRFIMGTPEPPPVDEDGYRSKILTGQVVLGIGAGPLLILLGFVLIRAIRKRRRPQYSLAWFLAMTVAAAIGLVGGLHWHFSARAFDLAEGEYKEAMARYAIARPNEKPAHEVTINRPFYLGIYEVTQEQYVGVIGTNPSWRKDQSDLPVEYVSWADAEEFCRRVSDGLGNQVRLPSESEWEYACRAGTKTTYCSGDTDADLDNVGWHEKNSGKKTHPVGQKTANRWDLYDMHGNVFEWCEDDWHDNYEDAPSDGRAWVDQSRGTEHVIRGGACQYGSKVARCAFREWIVGLGGNDLGFRVVLDLPPRRATILQLR